jgi:lysozyme
MLDTVLRRQLARDEGKKLTAYQDTNGFWTIGVGHLLGNEKRMTSITENECDALLSYDLDEAVRAVSAVFGLANVAKLDGPRWRALINMAFNRGEGRMKSSTTITPAIKAALEAMFNVGKSDLERAIAWDNVYKAIVDSPWAKQIGARAKRLAEQLQTGVDQ